MKRKPNWLLYGLTGGSLLLHGAVLLYMPNFYWPKAKAAAGIELTMCDITPAVGRDIPRPPARLANPRLPGLPVPAPPHPAVRAPKPAAKMPLSADIPVNRVEKIHPAGIAALPEPWTAGVVVEKTPPGGDRAPAVRETIQPEESAANRSGEDNGKAGQDYLAQIRTRIERHKRYPARARIRQLQGEVTIRFVITPTGDTQDLVVSKSSGREVLDQAALKAVRDASPFPEPPGDIFKGEITLELTIVFRLA